MPRFGQVLTAMVTPFDKNGELNLDGVRRLAKWLQDNGNDGLVVGGTTGEASTLTDDEKLALFAATVEAVTIPVIAGTVTNDTKHSIHLTKEASKLRHRWHLGCRSLLQQAVTGGHSCSHESSLCCDDFASCRL